MAEKVKKSLHPAIACALMVIMLCCALLNGAHKAWTKEQNALEQYRAAVLESVPTASVHIGDLEDLERLAAANGAQLLVCNSHGVEVAKRLGISLLRACFPLYDQVGGYARGWVGYRLARQALFDIANLVLGLHHEIPAYRSIYRDQPDSEAGSRCPQAGAGVVRH